MDLIKLVIGEKYFSFQVGYLVTVFSIKREILFKIFYIPIKLVRLIKMCLNETYSKVCIGRHLPDAFHVQNILKQEDALSAFFRMCH